jgi:hypothetical protein
MASAILDSLARMMGTPSEALESKRHMDGNLRFALDHLEEWRKDHPNQWVAVHGSRLIAAESSKAALLRVLREQHVPFRDIFVDFINEEKTTLIL